MRIDIAEDEDGKTFKVLLSSEKFDIFTMTEVNTAKKVYALVITEEMEQVIANEHYEH